MKTETKDFLIKELVINQNASKSLLKQYEGNTYLAAAFTDEVKEEQSYIDLLEEKETTATFKDLIYYLQSWKLYYNNRKTEAQQQKSLSIQKFYLKKYLLINKCIKELKRQEKVHGSKDNRGGGRTTSQSNN